MTQNLRLTLNAGTAVTASRNDGSTFSFTPTSCAANGNCPLNGNTFSFDGSWLYNWYAGTAGVGTTSSTGEVNGSICPKGWGLPQGGNGYAWHRLLVDKYGISTGSSVPASSYTKLRSAPLSFDSGISQGGNGWASNEAGSYMIAQPMVVLYYYGNDETGYFIHPTAHSGKPDGARIRCVAI